MHLLLFLGLTPVYSTGVKNTGVLGLKAVVWRLAQAQLPLMPTVDAAPQAACLREWQVTPHQEAVEYRMP